jgi:hypothetical protein
LKIELLVFSCKTASQARGCAPRIDFPKLPQLGLLPV